MAPNSRSARMMRLNNSAIWGAVTPWLLAGVALISAAYFLLPDGVIWTVRTLAQKPQPDPLALELPDGFQIQIFASGLSSPRFMQFDSQDRLFVAERGADQIVVLQDTNKDGQADSKQVLLGDLTAPTSVALTPDARGLYVAESHQIRLLELNPELQVLAESIVVPDLPAGGRHRSKTVVVGADNKLYVSIGSSCDVCEEKDERRAAVMQYSLDGSHPKLFARGLRNAVGMMADPQTGDLYVSTHGRDLLGDDIPTETVYRLIEGMDAGWPRCHSGDVLDPEYGQPGDCKKVTQPVFRFQAHSAPLGLFFYTGTGFPHAYRQGFFLAYHGSWNRSQPTGYKVVFVPRDGDHFGPEKDFVTGWLSDAMDVRGRPVGFAADSAGGLYVSDDRAGIIYKISYSQ